MSDSKERYFNMGFSEQNDTIDIMLVVVEDILMMLDDMSRHMKIQDDIYRRTHNMKDVCSGLRAKERSRCKFKEGNNE